MCFRILLSPVMRCRIYSAAGSFATLPIPKYFSLSNPLATLPSMAELFDITAGVLTVIEITTKIISKCKHLIETTRDALKDLRHIFVEISSLKAVFESLQFLSDTDTDFSDAIQNLTSTTGAVKGCRDTVEQLAQELSSPPVYLDSYSGTGK